MTSTAPTPALSTDDDELWEAADKPQWNPTFIARGRVNAEKPWACVLVKGQGKVLFDKATHPIDARRIALRITIEALLDGQRDTTREMIAESEEWARIVNPSIKAVWKAVGNPDGHLRDLNGLYVEAQLVPSGRKYTANGTERDATTFKFTKIFTGGEEECRAAAQAGRQPTVTEQGIAELNASKATSPFAASAPSASATTNGTASAAAERKSLAVFLPALWDQAGHDVSKFLAVLAANPQLAKHFPADSPEVMALVLPASTPAEEEGALPF